jgi:gamma-glutamylcyclotransferase (GGCT)/AIG2-like uncharacterized protein YtfP
MSCHGSHVNVAITRMAALSSSLDDAQVSNVFHRLKGAGSDEPPPGPVEYEAFLHRQIRNLDDLDLTDRQRNQLRSRLEQAIHDARTGNIPDGASFYAIKQLPAEVAYAEMQLDRTLDDAAERMGVSRNWLTRAFTTWRNQKTHSTCLPEGAEADTSFISEGTPSDRRTNFALTKLAGEVYYAEPLPVFVYGTLRSGQGNAGLMSGGVESKTPARIDGLGIYGADRGFPYATPNEGAVTVGEVVWLTSDAGGRQARDRLDQLEGFSTSNVGDDGDYWNHYDRVRRQAHFVGPDGREHTEEVWVYIAGPSVVPELDPRDRISDGDWVSASRNYRDNRLRERASERDRDRPYPDFEAS